MISKRRKLRALVATVTPELGAVSHRLRHHGKHHQAELWHATTVSDVINATTTPSVDRADICYTANEVLMIIGLTCILNLAFIVAVMSCVHFCSSPTVAKLSRLESLILVENMTSESDLDDSERRHNHLSFFDLSPVNRGQMIEDHLKPLNHPLQENIPRRSSSMVSLHTLVPACYSTLSSPSELHHHQHHSRTSLRSASSSYSMENLLFV